MAANCCRRQRLLSWYYAIVNTIRKRVASQHPRIGFLRPGERHCLDHQTYSRQSAEGELEQPFGLREHFARVIASRLRRDADEAGRDSRHRRPSRAALGELDRSAGRLQLPMCTDRRFCGTCPRHVLPPPVTNRLQCVLERSAILGQRIFDLRRNRRIHPTLDNPVGL